MKTHILYLTAIIFSVPGALNAAPAACSRANLTRCLDSACAINISSNPAARCQYCGTASAGAAPTKTGMKSVSTGASSKNTLTDKELKSAPSDPGERYAWATMECIKKLPTCTPDDVTDVYDSLIEQSCRAAGISAQMETLRADANKKKTKSACKTDITSCMVATTRCRSDYSGCTDTADFDKFLSECGVAATGCDAHMAAIRTELASARESAIDGAEGMLAGIVESYQKNREKKWASTKDDCKNKTSYNACIETICARSMKNKCGTGFEWERSAATQLCKFYQLACDTIK